MAAPTSPGVVLGLAPSKLAAISVLFSNMPPSSETESSAPAAPVNELVRVRLAVRVSFVSVRPASSFVMAPPKLLVFPDRVVLLKSARRAHRDQKGKPH